MDPKGANSQGWQLLNKDNDEVCIDVWFLFRFDLCNLKLMQAGAHALRKSLEQFGLKALLARVLQPKENSVSSYCF